MDSVVHDAVAAAGHPLAVLDREALDALRDKAKIRDLDAVVVLCPDRLARNYVHQMVLMEEFEKCGCRVEFVERPMSSEPDDQLLLQIRGRWQNTRGRSSRRGCAGES